MSTVPEVVRARQHGMKVLGLSVISNMASGIGSKKLSHAEVTETAALIRKDFEELMTTIVLAIGKMTKRLGQDHARAKILFEGLKQVRGLKLDPSPESNMVYFDLLDEVKLSVNQIVDEMKKRGVLVDWAGPRRFRLVTHYWLDDIGIEKTAKALAEVLK